MPLPIGGLSAPDSIEQWARQYLDAAVRGVRSAEVTDKIALHLARFRDHFHSAHSHDRLSAVVRREVVAWRDHLAAAPAAGRLGLAPATVNTHLASLSGFTPGCSRTSRPRCRPATPAPRSATCRCPRSNPRDN